MARTCQGEGREWGGREEERIVCTLTTTRIATGSLGAVSKVIFIFVNILPPKIRRLDKSTKNGMVVLDADVNCNGARVPQ